jgi:hypothetical protein
VALYAVDSLRQLVAKLLARAELEHYTHQEEALRPFVAVLRQCDEACVRELAVQCVMQVCLCLAVFVLLLMRREYTKGAAVAACSEAHQFMLG